MAAFALFVGGKACAAGLCTEECSPNVTSTTLMWLVLGTLTMCMWQVANVVWITTQVRS